MDPDNIKGGALTAKLQLRYTKIGKVGRTQLTLYTMHLWGFSVCKHSMLFLGGLGVCPLGKYQKFDVMGLNMKAILIAM